MNNIVPYSILMLLYHTKFSMEYFSGGGSAEYEKPSSLFGQNGDARILEVAYRLDVSIEKALLKAATGDQPSQQRPIKNDQDDHQIIFAGLGWAVLQNRHYEDSLLRTCRMSVQRRQTLARKAHASRWNPGRTVPQVRSILPADLAGLPLATPLRRASRPAEHLCGA